MSLSQPASRRSRKGTAKLEPPALFTTMSTCPRALIAAAIASSTESCRVTSAAMIWASRPQSVICLAVAASPSSPRATSARSAPACASATAIACPMPRDAPVTKAFLPVRSKGVTNQSFHSVGSGHAAGLTRRTISPSTIRTEGSPTQRCLARSAAISSACGTRAKRSACFRRPQIVVEAGHQDQERLSGDGPGVEVRVTRAVQRRRDQDRPLHRRVVTPPQHEFRAERPAHQPQSRQPGIPAPGNGGGQVIAFGLTLVEGALATAMIRRGAAGVEPEHGQIRHGRQAIGRLAQQVAVHHPAVRGQRVYADQGRHRVALGGQRQLAHQRQPVRRVQGDRRAPRWQHRAGPDLAHRLRHPPARLPRVCRCSRRCQQGLCQ